MKCVIYIRKVPYIMSCCQVARPCCRRYADKYWCGHRTSSTGAVVAIILGLYFVYDIVRCGIFWCGSLADIQTSRYVSYGLPLLICASGLLAICIVSLVRRLASCGMIVTWRSDSALSSESSKKCPPMAFHHQMAPAHLPESSRTRAHLPVLSRRLFGVCKRHLDRCFFVWYCTSPLRRFWYWYCDARMKGERGIGVGATFEGVYFLFFFAFYVLALRARTRPAIEFGSGEEGLRPASSSFSSSIRSWSTWT